MPYKVTKNGEIVCDTAEEAIALARAMEGKTIANADTGRVQQESNIRLTESRYKKFLSLLKGSQKELLNMLFESPHGENDKAIRTRFHLDSNKGMAGMFTAITKNARKVGIDENDIVQKEIVNVGDERIIEYKLGSEFRTMAEKLKIS